MQQWILIATAIAFLCLGQCAKADNPTSAVIPAGEAWTLVSEGHKFTEGPACDADGTVYFVDVPNSHIFKVGLDGTVTKFVENAHRASGLAFGPNGKLYACQTETKRIVRYDREGKEEVVAEGIGVNDLDVDWNGGVYVTDMGANKIWYITPKGEKTTAAEGFKPNGLTFWPNMGTLVVADADQPVLQTFRIEKDAALTFREGFYGPLRMTSQPKPGTDGMTVDDTGRLYVATHAGLQVFDVQGRLEVVIDKPQNKFLSNVAFGGPAFDTLFVTCSDKVYKLKTKVKGTPYHLAAPKS